MLLVRQPVRCALVVSLLFFGPPWHMCRQTSRRLFVMCSSSRITTLSSAVASTLLWCTDRRQERLAPQRTHRRNSQSFISFRLLFSGDMWGYAVPDETVTFSVARGGRRSVSRVRVARNRIEPRRPQVMKPGLIEHRGAPARARWLRVSPVNGGAVLNYLRCSLVCGRHHRCAGHSFATPRWKVKALHKEWQMRVALGAGDGACLVIEIFVKHDFFLVVFALLAFFHFAANAHNRPTQACLASG